MVYYSGHLRFVLRPQPVELFFGLIWFVCYVLVVVCWLIGLCMLLVYVILFELFFGLLRGRVRLLELALVHLDQLLKSLHYH